LQLFFIYYFFIAIYPIIKIIKDIVNKKTENKIVKKLIALSLGRINLPKRNVKIALANNKINL